MSILAGETVTALRDKLGEIGADLRAGQALARPAVLHCSKCGQAMRIAPQHMQTEVACPHCGDHIQPHELAAKQIPLAGVPLEPGSATISLSWRNRWVAGILGLILGPLGVHRFYLGYTGTGVLQIILTFCTAGIAGVWGFVEGVLLLVGMRFRDADGLPLRE